MTDQDRKLLELAAKAAGVELAYWNDGREPYSSGEGFILPGNAIWNPLWSNGAALRLAVDLNMDIVADPEGGRVYVGKEFFAEKGDDRLAATRRAIVRAAASLTSEGKDRG